MRKSAPSQALMAVLPELPEFVPENGIKIGRMNTEKPENRSKKSLFKFFFSELCEARRERGGVCVPINKSRENSPELR